MAEAFNKHYNKVMNMIKRKSKKKARANSLEKWTEEILRDQGYHFLKYKGTTKVFAKDGKRVYLEA